MRTVVVRHARLVTGLALLLAALPVTGFARLLQPLDAGWEQHFTLSWDTTQRRGQMVVEGYVNNVSPYSVTGLRVLVGSLDARGGIVSQRIAWVPGDLNGGGHLYFDVPVVPAASYRVRVFSYDRVESAGFLP
jgi:hypothetical protein